MTRKKFNIEELPKENHYKVPEGYFSDLNHLIMERVQGENAQEKVGLGTVLGRLSGFAVGFACIALLAMAGYYFTGYKAQMKEESSVEDYFFSMYDVSIDDIIDIQDPESLSNAEFADAAMIYLDTYGYGDYGLESSTYITN